MRRLARTVWLAWLALVGLARVTSGQEATRISVEPPRAHIGVFYDGVRLTVTSLVGQATDVAVLVSGPPSELELRRQARIWGVFWGPGGAVTFDGVPTVYLLRTSKPVDQLAPPEVLRGLGLGFASLAATVTWDADDNLLPELIRWKESERLFGYSAGAIGGEPVGSGRRSVTAEIAIPPKAGAAVYRVQLFGFQDGTLVEREETTFTLTRGPFNAFAGSLARSHGLLYGMLAVVVAVGAGLVVGFVFGSVKGH